MDRNPVMCLAQNVRWSYTRPNLDRLAKVEQRYAIAIVLIFTNFVNYKPGNLRTVFTALDGEQFHAKRGNLAELPRPIKERQDSKITPGSHRQRG